MRNIILLIILSIASTIAVHAKGLKFGKISTDEIAIKECSFEKDANALILSSSCKVDVNESVVRYQYHVRVKILKEEGLSYGNVELSYYQKDKREKIAEIKAQTINFDESGKSEITKVDSKAIYYVDRNENYKDVRFTLPKVKVGSIIEYKYVKVSTYHFYLDTWYFQEEIPVLKKSINVKFPDSFQYDIIMFGDKIRDKYKDKKTKVWELTNLPSIEEEPYVNNYMDFVEQIRFQLVGYYAGGGFSSSFNGSWKDLGNEYLNDINLSKRKSFAQTHLQKILKGNENHLEKIEKIYSYVQKLIKWDYNYRIYPRKSPIKLCLEKSGNSAEINLFLLTLLRQAGIKCDPALVRINKTGLILKKYPLMSQFNQVLVCTKINNQNLFLDATSLYRPYYLLSINDLNFHSFIIEKNQSHWEKIIPYQNQKQIKTISYDYSDLENPICHFRIKEDGYYALNRRRYISKNSKEDLFGRLVNSEKFEFDSDSIHIQNNNQLSKPLIISFCLPIEGSWQKGADIIYYKPLSKLFRKNPFLAEKRQFRIDFNYPNEINYTINIKLPKNYSLEEVPDPKSINIPNGGGKFIFLCHKVNNNITFRIVSKINKSAFPKEYYPYIKEFFSQIAILMDTQLVLKKNI